MKEKLGKLLTLLRRHIGQYETMAQLLTQEQSALIEMDLELIHQVTKEKENTALKIKMLVPAVADSIKEAAVLLGVPEDPLPTLAELASKAPPKFGKPLEHCGLALARIKRGISRHNDANRAFVREALDQISGSIAILTGAAAKPGHAYTKEGTKAPATGYRPVRLSREV